jgi:peptidoglycan/xylan/chitin deacetylase (PgdA/CDA1 family)
VYTDQLLAVLEKYNAKATFFVVDNGRYGDLRKIAAAGHSLGIHTISHDYKKIYANEDAFFAEVYALQDIICKHTGVTTTLLRFPGGSSNTVSKFNPGIMSRLTVAVQNAGFQYFDWNVDSNDAGGAKTAQEVFENVVNGCASRRVSIVLQHDIKGFSVEAVEKILIWGTENGYRFLALDPSSPGAHHGVNN